MLDRLKSLFGRGRDSSAVVAVAMERPDVSLSWQEGTTWPVPDWEAMAKQEQAEWTEARKDAFWSEVALQWLGRMATEWEHGYRVQASREFLLLSALPAREAKVFLEFCESARKRILRFLDGIASVHGSGKHVVIVFDDQDDYYDYVSNYYPDGGEYAMSSGMFIDAGYGHFVLWAGELHAMEPVIAHELTHCLVSHLPLPAWLNEGIAVNSEHRIFPQLAHPNAQQYFPHEMMAKHAGFWNASRRGRRCGWIPGSPTGAWILAAAGAVPGAGDPWRRRRVRLHRVPRAHRAWCARAGAVGDSSRLRPRPAS